MWKDRGWSPESTSARASRGRGALFGVSGGIMGLSGTAEYGAQGRTDKTRTTKGLVCVSSGCHNKYHRLGSLNNRQYFLRALGS